MNTAYKHVRFEHRDDVLIAHVQTSNLNDKNVEDFGIELATASAAISTRYIILDFQLVTNVTSSVLAQLLKFRKSCIKQKRGLTITDLSAFVQSVFEVTGLIGTIFVIAEDTETALAQLRDPQ